jgi:hypothetical protein
MTARRSGAVGKMNLACGKAVQRVWELEIEILRSPGLNLRAVEEDDGLDVGLKGWYDERLWVCGVWAVGGN